MEYDHNLQAWNDEGRISCLFSFKCPRTWESFTRTDDPWIRYCGTCARAVHLVYTEEELRQKAEAQHCVAVKLKDSDNLALGMTSFEYDNRKK